VRIRLPTHPFVAAALAVLALAGSAPAQAQVPRFLAALAPCTNGLTGNWRCATVRVYLDRAKQRGHVDLGLAFLHSPGPARPAIVGLAGGPGLPALSSAGFFANKMAPGLATHDLLVFDQRGTGVSDRLNCPEIESNSSWTAQQVRACAAQLGPDRGLYSSRQTAADIEDVRRLLGIPVLTLFGISYGTKTATDYARLYPSHVEALILDSVVSKDTDPFYRYSARSIVRILRDECGAVKCGYDPAVDIQALIRRQHHGYVGFADGSSVSEAQLLDLFMNNKRGLPQIPGLIHRALRGDPRGLVNDVSSYIPDLRAGTAGRQSRTLYLATTCDDSVLPWSVHDLRARRLAETGAWLVGAGSTFAPFTASLGWQYGVGSLCAPWPSAGGFPALPALPDVPALLLEGADDALTPVEEAQSVAAELPRAQLMVMAATTHVVLEQDPQCINTAVARFFSGVPVGASC